MFNQQEAQRFLQLLEPQNWATHRFSWLLLPDKAGVRNLYASQFQRCFAFDDDWAQCLAAHNANGHAVSICINAIDNPQAAPAGYDFARAQDISRVRAVFIDWDDPTRKLPAFALEPSILVASSAGKWHIYWLVDDLPLAHFAPLQKALAKRYGVTARATDRGAHNLDRKLRLPGSMRWKYGAAQQVRIEEASGVRYTAAQLREAFPYVAAPLAGAPAWNGKISDKANMVLSIVKANWPETSPGKYDIPCPFGSHDGDNRSSTSYYAPSEANQGRGGFKCWHASCERAGHRIGDFNSAILERALAAKQAAKAGAA